VLKERYCNIQNTLTMPGKSGSSGNSGDDAGYGGSSSKGWIRE